MNKPLPIRVLSVNLSTEKGTITQPVGHLELNSQGVKGDAHAGDWHRQVSMLGKESFDRFAKSVNRSLSFGEFAENITTEGVELFLCRPGDRFIIGTTELEVTQIGKKCHGKGCAIYTEVGNCVMPKEGIFCKVIRPGIIRSGDTGTYIPCSV
jgi:MOSC domain-containing protein YiiM